MGDTDGTKVGETDGTKVGDTDGTKVGETDGTSVGDPDGTSVGTNDGDTLGLLVGKDVRFTLSHTSSTSPYTPGIHSHPTMRKSNSSESSPLTPQKFQRTDDRLPSREPVDRKI